MALLFRAPYVLWSAFSDHSGIKVKEILKLASDPNVVNLHVREQSIRSATNHLKGSLRFQARRLGFHPTCSSFYVTMLFILKKIMYLVNVFFQAYIMSVFLQTDKHRHFGFGTVIDIIDGKTWDASGVFPRETLCDFSVRYTENTLNYTTQCVLTINIFNEKIYIFLWFWFILLTTLTFFDLLYWIITTFPRFRRSFLERHLEIGDHDFDPDDHKREITNFVDFLGYDGLLMLRIMASKGVIFGTDMIVSLWNSFLEDNEGINAADGRRRHNSDPDHRKTLEDST